MRGGAVLLPLTLLSLFATAAWCSAAESNQSPSSSVPDEEQTKKTKDKPLHVVLTTTPFQGHFFPVRAIAEQLVLRGHRATVLIENTAWCDGPVPLNCIELPKSNIFTPELFDNVSQMEDSSASMVILMQATQDYHATQSEAILAIAEEVYKKDKFDFVLSDTGSLHGINIAHKHNVPYGGVYPLVMRCPVEMSTYLPVLGSGTPRAMTFFQRWWTFFLNYVSPFILSDLVKQYNVVRAKSGIRPFEAISEATSQEALMFSPTIWGYDIPHPLCPNIRPLGVLSPLLTHIPMEEDLESLLNSPTCKEGALYINFGTVSKQSDRAFETLIEAFVRRLKRFCVVWKVIEEHRRGQLLQVIEESGGRERFYISKRFASPIAIMGHHRVTAFLTHCGSTSVGESVVAQVPLMGIPYFADQDDACRRMHDAGHGRHIGHKLRFTAEQIVSASEALAENRTYDIHEKENGAQSESSFLRALARSKKMAEILGGPAKAAEIIETEMRAGLYTENPSKRGSYPFTCRELVDADPFIEYGYYNVTFYILLWALMFYKLLSRCCGRL